MSQRFQRVNRRFRKSLAALLVLIVIGGSPLGAAGEPADDTTAERQALLKEMRSAAGAMKVSEQVEERAVPAELIGEPVFRYSDEQRQIRDATMWVWTVQGRPVSLMKLERYGFPEPQRRWLFNIGSTTSARLNVQWPFGREFTSQKPGMTFQRMMKGADAAETKAARLVQLRQLARRFSATMTGGAADDAKTEMRLLPTPLFRYASPPSGLLDGALFGLSATGTNPDAILAIHWRGELNSAQCEFAVTGMTTGGLQVRLDDQQVWSQPYLVNRGQVFDTWTWFFSERAE